MSSYQSAAQIAQSREVNATAVINGQCDLRGYPYRHLGVVADASIPMPRTTAILVAVEILSNYGWELVSVTRPFENVHKLVAFLRLR